MAHAESPMNAKEGEPRPRIRVRPAELEIDPEDPFEGDVLERKDSILALTALLAGIDGPAVLAVDAPWGSGKTTFLRMWEAHLRNEGFEVASFSAWESDIAGEPFAALVAELSEELAGDDAWRSAMRKTRKAAVEVIKRAVPVAMRLGTAGLMDASTLVESEFGGLAAGAAESALRRYSDGKKSVKSFRDELAGLAREVRAARGCPLVIMVDELDRCRPLYAVELLEAAKHLFGVDGIIFLIALDRSELAHSVRAVYGQGFDAMGYLRRFFDVDFVLRQPNRERLIRGLLLASGIERYIASTPDREAQRDHGVVTNMFVSILSASQVGARAIGQEIHRMGVVLASLPAKKRTLGYATASLILLRLLAPDEARSLRLGTTSDEQVLDAVFRQPGMLDIRGTLACNQFEAAIIRGVTELGLPATELSRLAEAVDSDDPRRSILQMVSDRRSGWHDTIGFSFALRRLNELAPLE